MSRTLKADLLENIDAFQTSRDPGFRREVKPCCAMGNDVPHPSVSLHGCRWLRGYVEAEITACGFAGCAVRDGREEGDCVAFDVEAVFEHVS